MPIPDPTPGPIVPHRGATVSGPKVKLLKPSRGSTTSIGDLVPGDGMIIVFSAIAGLTARGVLEKPFVFQCPPLNEWTPQFAWTFDDYATVNSGIHTNPNYPQLSTFSFDTLIVDAVFPTPHAVDPNYPFVVARVENPLIAQRALKKLGEKMTPFQLQAGYPRLYGAWEPLGRGDQAAVAVTMRGLRPTIRAGEPDARYLTVDLTEFPDAPALTAIQPPKLIAGTERSTRHGERVTSTGRRILDILNPLELPPGWRTMADLAKHYYGSTSAWHLIARASGFNNISGSEDLKARLSTRSPVPKVVIPARQKRPG